MNIKFSLSDHDEVRQVAFHSPEMKDIVDLRSEILRKPLNLHFTAEQLAAEVDYYHLGYYRDNILLACLMLVPDGNGKMKMKQVAVKFEYQGKGIGKKLVESAEYLAGSLDCNTMFCHARDSAVPFYKSMSYIIKGEVFTEVGIPHYYMEKELSIAAS